MASLSSPDLSDKCEQKSPNAVADPSKLCISNVLHSKDKALLSSKKILANPLVQLEMRSSFVQLNEDVDALCAELLSAILQQAPTLKYLHLEGIPLHNGKFIEILQNSELTTLVLIRNGLDAGILTKLDVYLKPNILQLRIEENNVDTLSVDALARLISQCKNLEKLSLKGCSMHFADMEKLVGVINSSLTDQLCELNLFDNDCSQCIVSFINNLENYRKLTYINLGACAIGNVSAVALMTKLKDLQVAYVDLSNNLINKEGCVNILKTLRNSKIKTLHLWGNPFCVAENREHIIQQMDLLVAEYQIVDTFITWRTHEKDEQQENRRIDWSDIAVFMDEMTFESFASIHNIPEKMEFYLANFKACSLKGYVDLLFKILKFYSQWRNEIRNRSSNIAANFFAMDIVSVCELILFSCLTPIFAEQASENDLVEAITSRLVDSKANGRLSMAGVEILQKICHHKWLPAKLIEKIQSIRIEEQVQPIWCERF